MMDYCDKCRKITRWIFVKKTGKYSALYRCSECGSLKEYEFYP